MRTQGSRDRLRFDSHEPRVNGWMRENRNGRRTDEDGSEDSTGNYRLYERSEDLELTLGGIVRFREIRERQCRNEHRSL